jgi:hypothetical protein
VSDLVIVCKDVWVDEAGFDRFILLLGVGVLGSSVVGRWGLWLQGSDIQRSGKILSDRTWRVVGWLRGATGLIMLAPGAPFFGRAVRG